jgi:hypothetical protein
MAGRSTRNKIQYHFKQAIAAQADCLEHMRTAHEMSGERIPLFDEVFPTIISMIDIVTKMLNATYEQL